MSALSSCEHESFTAWFCFLLMDIQLGIGLYMHFWPIWLLPSLYFAGIGLAIFTDLCSATDRQHRLSAKPNRADGSVAAWFFAVLMLVQLCLGLYLSLWPIWALAIIYFSIVGVNMCAELSSNSGKL